jgi:hypothetical protein
MAACSSGVSQEDYDELSAALQQTQDDLEQVEATLTQTEASLEESQELLDAAQKELADIKANPPVLELQFVDIGDIARVTDLKMAREATEGSTYIIEGELELLGELPDLVNVVDVELYVNEQFRGSYRWIDISSTGFVTQKTTITIDTGVEEFVGPIKLKIVPSFKVF